MELPRYYEFYCGVKTVAGHTVLENIPAMLAELQAENPMIITDKGVTAAGLVDIVRGAIEGQITIGAIEDDVPPDSDLKAVNRIALAYREKKCDAIVAVGGGSVLDTAKGVNIIVSEDADDLMKFTGAGALKRKLKPLLAVPTTAGTGSEVTLVAVIADHEKNRKMLFTSPFLLPDVAILDSRMTLTLPPFLTALTGMDALTHAVESYICMGKNPISDAHALEAISLISRNLAKVVKDPGDEAGRLALASAANLAGIAFSNAMVGMVHTLGHSVGAVCHVPHGTCMSILLPYGMEYNLHKTEARTAELLYALAGDRVFAETPKKMRAEKAIACIRQMNQELHDLTEGKHPRFFKEVFDREGNPMVPEESIGRIAKTALGDASIFYNPEDLDFEDCVMVLEAAYEGVALDRARVKKG